MDLETLNYKINIYKKKTYNISRMFFGHKVWKWIHIFFGVYNLYQIITVGASLFSTLYVAAFLFFGSVYLLGKNVWYVKTTQNNNQRNRKHRASRNFRETKNSTWDKKYKAK